MPQVTAAEAAGQVLSNSVGRVMVERVRMKVARSQGLGKMMEFPDVVEHNYVDQLIQEHAGCWEVRGCKMQAPTPSASQVFF